MDQLMIRRAFVADAEGIAHTHIRSWRASRSAWLPQAELDKASVERSLGFMRRVIPELLPHQSIWVAECDDRIVGLALVDIENASPPTGELFGLFVDPDSWDKGIGSRLLSTVMAFFREWGCTSARVWVDERDDRAQVFLKQRGWFEATERHLRERRYVITIGP